MTQISIIISFSEKTNPQEFEETLISVLENRPERSEVIVANSGGYRDPYLLGEGEVRFIDLTQEKSLIQSLNIAVESAAAPIVNILSSGTVVEEHWANQPIRAFENPYVAVAMTPVFDRWRRNRLVSTGITYYPSGVIRNQKSLVVAQQVRGVGPHIANAFFRKSVFLKTGGLSTRFCQQISYLDFGMMLGNLRLQTELIPSSRVHFASQIPLFPSLFQRSRQTEQLFLRWSYENGWLRNMVSNFLAVSAEFWGSFPDPRMISHLAGRVAGLGHYGAHKIRQEELERLIEELSSDESFESILQFDTEKHEREPISKVA